METDWQLLAEIEEAEDRLWQNQQIAESLVGSVPQSGLSFSPPGCIYPLTTSGIDPDFIESTGFCGLVPGFSPEYDTEIARLTQYAELSPRLEEIAALLPETLRESLGMPTSSDFTDPVYSAGFAEGFQSGLTVLMDAARQLFSADDPAFSALSEYCERESRTTVQMFADGYYRDFFGQENLHNVAL